MSQTRAQSIQCQSVVTLCFKWFAFTALATAASFSMPDVVFAQETTPKNSPSATQISANPTDDEITELRQKVQKLSADVDQLRREVAKLEKYQQIDYLRDLMVKEENRVLASQKELVEIGAKEMPLQKRLDEIEKELRPDRIQQSLAGVGSMRPEQERESIERQLANEKRRIQAQLDQFRQNRGRLQSVISTAEASIATLRQRLREAVRLAGIRENN